MSEFIRHGQCSFNYRRGENNGTRSVRAAGPRATARAVVTVTLLRRVHAAAVVTVESQVDAVTARLSRLRAEVEAVHADALAPDAVNDACRGGAGCDRRRGAAAARHQLPQRQPVAPFATLKGSMRRQA